MADCRTVVEAGAAILLRPGVSLLNLPKVRDTFPVPVIGIGAGVDYDGQVLVMHTICLRVYTRKFVKDFWATEHNK